jgi:hypothetical protein
MQFQKMTASLVIPTAFAARDEAQQAAQSLHELGLFSGTGTDANGQPDQRHVSLL